MHFWTKEETEFLRVHYPLYSRRQLLDLFNQHFNLNIQIGQLRSCLKNHKITSGRTGRFEKGKVPLNKGLNGVTTGGIATQFKKGHRPKNYKPVGTERVDRDGYVLIKVSDTGAWHERWRHKHKVIWEEVNGPIPKGHCLLFLDRNKQNISLDNLQLITQSQLARLNQNKLLSDNPELTKTGLIIADIYEQISTRKKASEI